MSPCNHGAIPPLRGLNKSRLACRHVETDPNPRGRRNTNRPVVGLTGARFGGAAGRRSRAAVEPPETDDAVAASDHRLDPVAGPTAARFPSMVSRWWDAGGEMLHQFLQYQEKQPEQRAVAQPDIAASVPEPGWTDGTDWNTLKKTSKLVRPYSWTGGRTTSPVNLEVETLVSATGRPADPAAPPEHRTILGLCTTPRSVAEVAALLKMPLGVARVLLGDLAAAGSLAVHRTVGSTGASSDVALMQRVIDGLQRL